MRHIQTRLIADLAAALFLAGLAAGGVLGQEAKQDNSPCGKSDKNTKVTEGKEFKLTPVKVTPSAPADDLGRYYAASIVPAKEPVKVTMPKELWALGFYPKAAKTGVGVAGLTKDSGLAKMRHNKGDQQSPVSWADPGDVITHVNGYAVNSVEELLCAVSVAKDKSDVQVVLKDSKSGYPFIFHVSATKR